ncbi:MAG TPA: hypothetical protein VHC39_03550 [Rhizomicrobium sp.]|nr:hypothetical protein [Rhizomicrobium sp.]
MGGETETQAMDDTRTRLLNAARAMVLGGDNKFSISTVCREAGIARAQFRDHFSGKTALMAALMQEQAAQPVSEAPLAAAQPAPETPKLEIEAAKAEARMPTEEAPKAETPKTDVAAPDAWLERRLRVFERALTALEARAEATAREQARVIAQLEERIVALSGQPAEQRLAAPLVEAVAEQPASQECARQAVATVEAAAPVMEEPAAPAQEPKPVAELLAIAPLPIAGLSREAMADVLQSARDKARAAAARKDEDKPKDKNRRLRWLAFGGLSLLVLFAGIGFTLGNSASATQNDRMADWQGGGITHRHLAQGALAQTIAAADYGDATAEARLALAYLRGQGVARDAGAAFRWSKAAAANGAPAAQYLLGALYQQGEAVKADPAQAFAWFSIAAAHGNLKAMHNLAIAYAEGQGTAKDEEKAARWFKAAAERGYVDSAFDLAVMYERGAGVTQDPRQALMWYAIAAHAGDGPSQARADFLRGQMKAGDARLAVDAARNFFPIPALPTANSL